MSTFLSDLSLYLDEFPTHDSVEEGKGTDEDGLEAQADGEHRDGEHGTCW